MDCRLSDRQLLIAVKLHRFTVVRPAFTSPSVSLRVYADDDRPT